MKSKIDFVEGNTGKSLMKMVLPLLLSMILMMAYNLVDSLWVGNLLGETGYAALTNSTAVVLILSAIAMGMSNGISILISQTIGAGDKKKTEALIATVIVMSVAFAVAITVLLEVFMNPVLSMLHTPTEIYEETKSYLSVYLIGYVVIYLYMQFTSVFRSFGDPMFQMKGMLMTTLFNAVLDPILIHFQGLFGAALATVISEVLCLVYAAIYYKVKKMFQIDWSGISLTYAKELLKDAVPSAIQGCMPAISSAALLTLVSGFGVTTLAAYGVTNKIEILLFYPAMAMNMALTTIVGQCHGAGRNDRVKDYMRDGLILGGVFIAVVSMLVIIFAGNISGLFVQSAQVAEIVKGFFAIVSIGYVLYMLTSCFLGELSGFGKPVLSMILMFVYYIVIRVPLAVALDRGGFGLNGIWSAILISHILAAVLASILGILNLRKEKAKKIIVVA